MAETYHVSSGNFYDRVTQIVKECCDENTEAMVRSVTKAARTSRNALRKRKGTTIHGTLARVGSTGKYAAGWQLYMGKRELADGHFDVTVANKTKPSLTHLLEDGHVKYIFGRGPQGFVDGDGHIEAAYEEGAEILRGQTVDNP